MNRIPSLFFLLLLSILPTSCLPHQMEVRSPSTPGSRVLSAEPSGASADELLVMVGSLFRWDDSTLVVTDMNKFHAISEATGRMTHSFGRRGRDAGEFQYIAWAGRMDGDSLVIFDSGALGDQLTLVGPDFSVRREERPYSRSENVFPACRLQSGELVLTVGGGPERVVDSAANVVSIRPGIVAGPSALRLYDRNGVATRELAVSMVGMNPLGWPGPVWVGAIETNVGPVRTVMTSVPLGPRSFIRCEGETLYWATGSTPVVHRDISGRTETIALSGLEAIAIDETDRRAAVDSAAVDRVVSSGGLVLRESAARFVAEAMNGFPVTHLPYFVDLRIAENGAIWVLRPRIEGRAADGIGGEKVWSVYSESGAFLRDVRLPASFDLRFITDDALWGAEPGPFGDPRVVKRELP